MSQDGAQGRHAGSSVAGGRYQLRRLLGEGGMASVYLAYDSVLERQVAIKTLHSELGREQSFRERFRREAQAVAKLSHTNIVSVFDTGEDRLDGAMMPYIVMEYVEGRPLGDLLQEDIAGHGAMPAQNALRITADVLAALDTSHEVGLVHRDIKPGNVMVTGRGVVKVMDFGIARAMQSGVTSMTQTGMVVGTPQYLSPEQALGRAVDARSDLYSVGIMLFQLLTGRLPFDADSPLAIAYAHVQENPAAPSSINRSVTPAMDALVARALRKNPNERFPSAAAMRDECLRVAAAGQTGAPMIIGGAPAPSGSGVGSAVFPPLGQSGTGPHTPSPQQGGAPYQQQPGPYGPSTPPPVTVPPPAPHYGYPPVAHGQQGGYPQQQGAPTPPFGDGRQQPATGTGSGGGSGGGRGKTLALIVTGSLLALVILAGILDAILDRVNGIDDNGEPRGTGQSQTGDTGSRETAGTGDTGGSSGSSKVIPPDRTRTIEASKCSDASEDGTDPSKVYAPDLRYKDVLSVKECLREAGWTWKVTTVDNPQYPQDAVVEQFPSAGSSVLPEEQEFELRVSTGKAG
jgi:eukaryotic-like serine/threonine-protein kinase